MRLVVQEVKADGVIQEFTPTQNTLVYAVRPHIYRHLNPSGSLQLQILDTDDNVLVESEEIEISSIGSADYYHGYVRFLIDIGLKKDVTYRFKLIGTDGYSYSDSAFIGWCNGYDLGKYPEQYTPSADAYSALDCEIWKRTTK
jgi:hypothetical protein